MTRTLLDKGHELREQYAGILEVKAANRRSLRDLAAQGFLSDEELLELDELYPPRKNGEDEQAAE